LSILAKDIGHQGYPPRVCVLCGAEYYPGYRLRATDQFYFKKPGSLGYETSFFCSRNCQVKNQTGRDAIKSIDPTPEQIEQRASEIRAKALEAKRATIGPDSAPGPPRTYRVQK
jgi:hypothetical protein